MNIHLQVSFGGEKKGADRVLCQQSIWNWSMPSSWINAVIVRPAIVKPPPRNVVMPGVSGHALSLSEHDVRKHETEWAAGAQFWDKPILYFLLLVLLLLVLLVVLLLFFITIIVIYYYNSLTSG